MLRMMIAALTDVEEKYRGLYTEHADKTFRLDVTQLPDPTGLKVTNAELIAEKKILKEAKDKLAADLAALETAASTEQAALLLKDKKFEELLALTTATNKTALEAAQAEAGQARTQLTSHINNGVIQALATKLAGVNAALITPHLGGIAVSMVGGIPTTTYTLNGAATTAELYEQSITSNEMFKPILQGRQSSGGGSGGGAGSGTPDTSTWDGFFNPSDKQYNLSKQIELQAKDPAAYKSLTAKYNLDDPYA